MVEKLTRTFLASGDFVGLHVNAQMDLVSVVGALLDDPRAYRAIMSQAKPTRRGMG
jgi:hypothetical protein